MAMVLTADGCIDAALVTGLAEDCACPRPLCDLNVCSLMCNFVQLLPNGPLWDRAKGEALRHFQNNDCFGTYCYTDDECGSLVDFAVYTGRRFHNLVMDSLWPALREANPLTAYETLDSWLDRLGWQDCWASACRDKRLGTTSPYETEGLCAPLYCPPTIPDDLACAVKRGIVLSLIRLQMRPVATLCGINWVIEPLGAVLTPLIETCENEGFTTKTELHCCTGARFELNPIASQDIQGCTKYNCGEIASRIPAWFEETDPVVCPGDPTPECTIPLNEREVIWPGVMAAQCIALSMLPVDDCELTVPIVRGETRVIIDAPT